MTDGHPHPEGLPPEDLTTLYDEAPCGYLTTWPDGTIVRANRRVLEWTGRAPDEVLGRRFVDLLSPGGRIFHETHYAPLVQMQGTVADIALDLEVAGGGLHPVVVASTAVPASGAVPAHVRTTLVDATGRHEYERELLAARHRAEASEVRVREVADVLQHSLLEGAAAQGPGFLVETRYRAAVEGLDVGGDWFDSFLVNDGAAVSVSVGDVVGRGVRAASVMGQLRSAVRALSGASPGPGEVLDHLDRFVARVPGAWMATVVVVELVLATGDLRWCRAGHLPPLVLAGGRSELLAEAGSPPLAAYPLDAPRAVGHGHLPVGGRLLLVTDGLVERPGRTLDDGLERLRAAAAPRAHLPLGVMVDEVVDELLADEAGRDDVCVLALERRGDPADASA